MLGLSPAPLSTFACLFISFLRASAWEIASYSLCLTVELCVFIIWLHPFSLQCFPILTRSLWILIISSDRLKIFLSFIAPSYLWAVLSTPSPKPFLKNIGQSWMQENHKNSGYHKIPSLTCCPLCFWCSSPGHGWLSWLQVHMASSCPIFHPPTIPTSFSAWLFAFHHPVCSDSGGCPSPGAEPCVCPCWTLWCWSPLRASLQSITKENLLMDK